MASLARINRGADRSERLNWRAYPSKASLLIILLVMWFILGVLTDRFFAVENLNNLGRQTAITAMVAMGETFVILTGGIDLSVGSTVGLASVVAAKLMAGGASVAIGILAGVVAGLVVGLVNGILVYDGKLPPFIATLGTMTMARGVVLVVTDARIITGLPREFNQLAEMTILGIPSLVFLMLVLGVLGWIILQYTTFGRHLFALGSSQEAVRLSGVNVRLVTYGAYVVSGLLSAIAGVLLTARLSSGIPTSGLGYELEAIAASVIGGASLNGAQGSMQGTAIGALIMATLRNGGNLLGVEPFWLEVAIGFLLVAVVFFDQVQKRTRV